jgi:hypothetical protein
VPWPPSAQAVVCALSAAASRKRAVRLALQRWHPDRWWARFGARVAPEQREAVLRRVTEFSAGLTALK